MMVFTSRSECHEKEERVFLEEMTRCENLSISEVVEATMSITAIITTKTTTSFTTTSVIYVEAKITTVAAAVAAISVTPAVTTTLIAVNTSL